ncbi:MAG: hypothetical protein RL122_2294 [Pseudomonadota bacterium]|uniref:AAA family ATPase n=1 Tax=Thiothrix fructosivorans TaxID=111770 RepID=A0A8B0SGZ6_9GAMM|nr:AAA family ATPase [Thiothrix fructosivorans]MBO0614546.1 AAA family ATPase [Thiothrix fructosivorans]QTX09378.1 AAA family ATPase [Thiothrix fructosivorans]
MSQHFIENIKIENFKCFENLEINDFKRVNVFGGKNNVGKTALLEAIELLVKSVEPNSLIYNSYLLLKNRQQRSKNITLDFYKDFPHRFEIKSNIRTINIAVDNLVEFHTTNTSIANIEFSVNHGKSNFSTENFSNGNLYGALHDYFKNIIFNSYFIKSSKIDDKFLSVLYGFVSELNKEDFVNNSINNFDSSIMTFKIIQTEDEAIPKLKIQGRDKLVPLSEMGDGISRYVTILCAIWASQNGFLFIDEIENGIHYSNYKKLWELIFMASEQANCQVFVTTHSKECIEAFNNVQQERNDDTGRYFELYRSEKKQRIVAAVRDAEQLHYSLTHGAAIRGE